MTDDDIKNFPVYKRKTYRKAKRKPLKESRKIYEESKPPVGTRLERVIYDKLHIDAAAVGMSVAVYLTHLIENNHVYIEKIKEESRKEGEAEGYRVGHEHGLSEGKQERSNHDFQKIWKYCERYFALMMRCCNCGQLIPVTPDHVPHLERLGWLCPRCDLSARMAKYDPPPPKKYPSWWPKGYDP